MTTSLIIQQLVFFVFAALTIIAAIMVVVARNPVYNALFLVMAFVCSAVLWILMQAEFLGLILILVYVGAVMTMLLFVVMMIKLEPEAMQTGSKNYGVVLLSMLTALAVLGMMIYVVGPNHFGPSHYAQPLPHRADYSNIGALGEVLYTQYLYPFELAAVILLVALIAAIGLTFRGPRNRKRQIPEEQMLVKRDDRLTIIKMPAEPK